MDEGEYHAAMERSNRLPDVSALRRDLVAAGYTPLPLFGKAPPTYGKNGAKKGLGRWQHLEDVTDGQIDDWAAHWPDATNTGILTKFAPALDIDILNDEAAIAIEEAVARRFEDHGIIMVRIGKAPKRAILFRTETPFKKILANVTAPNGGAAEKLEFLGDGQQLAVAGIHPDAEVPYRWHGGELGKVSREDLPLITAEEAQALIADLIALLIDEFGYQATRRKSAGKARADAAGSDWAEPGPMPPARTGRSSTAISAQARRCMTACAISPPSWSSPAPVAAPSSTNYAR